MAREISPQLILSLQREVDELERRLEEGYCQLGKDIYEVAEHGIGEVNRLVDCLVEAKKRFLAISPHLVCSACQAENPIDSQYCRHCGTPLPAQERTDAS